MTTTDPDVATDGYEAFYGLAEPPFSLNADPRFLFEGSSHAAAFALVMQALRRRETLIVVTGEIGTGKTMLCRTVLQRLPQRTFLSVITNPLLDSTDLLKQVLEDFGILSRNQDGLSRASHHDLIRTLEQFLASLVQLKAHAVLMIDEAQHLRPDVLEHIRLLSNFETEGSKLLQIVLVGQPELSEILARPDMRPLEQRISHRIELRPLEPGEIGHYIDRRLGIAHRGLKGHSPSGSRARFAPPALEAITDCSRGLPRVINLLCDRALENAYSRKTPTVDAGAILTAARQLEIPIPVGTRLRPHRYLTAAAVVILAAAGLWIGLKLPGFGKKPPAGAETVATGLPAGVASSSGAGRASASPDPARQAGTLHEGETFTLLVASFRTSSRAKAVAEQAAANGLPAFIRVVSGDWQQVLAGPYASEVEALDAQRHLDPGLVPGSRIVTRPTSDAAISSSSRESSAVTRAFLLPAADRASIVVDLADDAARAVVLKMSDDRSFDVEIGPFRQSVVAEDLEPAATSPVVGAVAVRGVTQPNETLAHVSVKARTPVTGAVRLSKRRVYIDLAPRLPAAETLPVIPAVVSSAETPAAKPLTSALPPASLSSEEWERAMLEQARELSKRPDVRTIERLRAELLRRRGRPADEPPIATSDDRVMTELIGYLEVAQKLQLAMDARLLRETQDKNPR